MPLPQTSAARVGARLRVAGLLWAALLGAGSGLAAALLRLFYRALGKLLTGSAANPPVAAAMLAPGRRLLIPILGAGLALAVLVLRRWRAHRLGREPRPFVEYVEAARHGHGQIPLVPNLWRTLSAAFSVASGAAVGREGSMIQFAAAIASAMERAGRRIAVGRGVTTHGMRPLSPELVIACGVAAGVTVAYVAPVAGVLFAMEIVLCRRKLADLPPLAISASLGYAVSRVLLRDNTLYPTHPAFPADGWGFLLLPILAVLFGAAGPAYQRLIGSLGFLRKLPGALLLGGLVTGALSLLDPRVWGNGDAGLSAALGIGSAAHLGLAHVDAIPGAWLGGAGALFGLLVLRLAATSACTGAGTVGGVFTPTLFAGAAVASVLAAVVGHVVPGVSPPLWALVGMSCLIAAATHAPLMAGFMGAELTGDWRLLPGLLLLNLIASGVARTLSPDALYAIASVEPTHHGLSRRRNEASVRGMPDGIIETREIP